MNNAFLLSNGCIGHIFFVEQVHVVVPDGGEKTGINLILYKFPLYWKAASCVNDDSSVFSAGYLLNWFLGAIGIAMLYHQNSDISQIHLMVHIEGQTCLAKNSRGLGARFDDRCNAVKGQQIVYDHVVEGVA